jgi:hypothetical protein
MSAGFILSMSANLSFQVYSSSIDKTQRWKANQIGAEFDFFKGYLFVSKKEFSAWNLDIYICTKILFI